MKAPSTFFIARLDCKIELCVRVIKVKDMDAESHKRATLFAVPSAVTLQEQY